MKKQVIAAVLVASCAWTPAVATAQDLSSSAAAMSSITTHQYDPGLPWDIAQASRAKTYRSINLHRMQHGRMPWLKTRQLDASAQAWAEHLSRTNSFHHSSANVYENIAFSTADPNRAFAQWRNSPEHNANMLGNATQVGIGAAHAYVAGYGWGFIVVMQAK